MKHISSTLILALAASLAAADTVYTTDGRRLEGKVKDLGNEILLEGKYGSTRFSKAQIEKIEYGKTTLETYAEKAAALNDADAAGHWALAKWCKDNSLEAEYRKEAAKVVAADPEHEAARLALGHKRVGERWMSNDEIHEANGEVKRNGEWMTQDEADRLDAEENVRKLLGQAGLKDPAKHEAAVAELLNMRQDALLAPCSRSVTSSNRGTRIAAWKGIERWGVWTRNTLAFVRDLQARFDKLGDLTGLALREKDEEVRGIAIAATRGFGDEYAKMWYQKRVVEEEGDSKVRAADVLGDMGSADSVPYLMAAFYSVYMEIRATNAQTVQDITDSFVDFIADPERRVITQPLRIETPKLAIQRVKTTGVVPEGWHSTASSAFAANLRKITEQKYGNDYVDWNTWYRTDGKNWVKEKVAAERKAAEEKAGK
jgi:hypothetical protein